MLQPFLTVEEIDFLKQFPSQDPADQQRAINRILNRQDDGMSHQTYRFLQNLYCKLQILNVETTPGRTS